MAATFRASAHSGTKAVLAAVLPRQSWRCSTRFGYNSLQASVPSSNFGCLIQTNLQQCNTQRPVRRLGLYCSTALLMPPEQLHLRVSFLFFGGSERGVCWPVPFYLSIFHSKKEKNLSSLSIIPRVFILYRSSCFSSYPAPSSHSFRPAPSPPLPVYSADSAAAPPSPSAASAAEPST